MMMHDAAAEERQQQKEVKKHKNKRKEQQQQRNQFAARKAKFSSYHFEDCSISDSPYSRRGDIQIESKSTTKE